MLPAQELKISVHYIDTVVLMSEDGLSFQICKDSDYTKASKKAIESLRKDVRVVFDGLKSFNKDLTGCLPEEFWIFIRNKENKIVGGLLGYTMGDRLHINILWVDEPLRNKGNGSKLLRMAEDLAIKRGCKQADLDTLSPQAGFYEKNGYTVFGILPGCRLIKHSLKFMKKDLP